MKDLLTCTESRGKPVADIEQGYISALPAFWRISRAVGRTLK
jgi:hypothetical protein